MNEDGDPIKENGGNNHYATRQVPELPSGSFSPSPSNSFGHQSMVIGGTRFRIGICGIVALTVTILLLALLFIVILAAVILVYFPVPLIRVALIGNLTGGMNASLGSLGNAYLTPELKVDLALVV